MINREQRILEEIRVELPKAKRPRTRQDCVSGPRPCPWLGCTYHLALDVSQAGRVLMSPANKRGHHVLDDRLDNDRWQTMVVESLSFMPDTCAIDVAEDEERTLQEIGNLMGLTRERVRQIQNTGLIKLKKMTQPNKEGDYE